MNLSHIFQIVMNMRHFFLEKKEKVFCFFFFFLVFLEKICHEFETYLSNCHEFETLLFGKKRKSLFLFLFLFSLFRKDLS